MTQELADALKDISPSEAARVASRYAALKDFVYVTADGDKLDAKAYDLEVEYCRELIKRYVEKHGPLTVEGVGTLRLQDRALAWNWDVRSLAENDPATFARLLELGCVTLNTKVADAQEKAGNVTGFRGYGHRGGTSALVIQKGE